MRLAIVVLIACAATACVRSSASVEQQGPTMAAGSASRSVLLERPRCYGECPAYKVKLASDGSVRFEGIANVSVKAVREWRVPVDSAARVFHFADSIRFGDLLERYDFGVPGCTPFMADREAFAITVTSGAQSKRVYADEGCANVPSALKALGKLIDRTTRLEGSLYLRP